MLSTSLRTAPLESIRLASQALREWTARTWTVAIVAGVLVALVVGAATVLIPNPVFGREIAPVWWNYPVWLVTSALSGMLLATYVRGGSDGVAEVDDAQAERTGRLGMAGAVIAWFAVGCPVCNKIALIALGYSGALTWFAPFQPVLAVAALVLTGGALIARLRGEIACAVPTVRAQVSA
ncbi:hypothetical protein [Demequina muriae]|uniref:Uncharacterized protein n=1 Tax=Demequina muriae TaxID=3051664 RepID=A0ABT8GDJ7_9MICO|nr:hypothetical protein [Demequina sp. EGI L300058]MDN4479501.1 hypothetical protein [Demequina sp. EGI L300058]